VLVVSGAIGWQVLGSGGLLPGGPAKGGHRLALREVPAAATPSSVPTDHRATLGGVGTADQVAGSPGSKSLTGPNAAIAAPINPPGGFSKLIKTGRMSIVVGHDAFGERFTRIGDIADALGGYVATSSTSGGRSGFVTIRIPARRFQAAVRSLRGLGRVTSEQIQGQDVTAQDVDLKARIRIAKSRRTVLLRLMNKATTIDETIRVQNALDDVQLRIEDLQGELNVLNDRVAEATLRVSMREQGVKTETVSTVTNPSLPNAFEHAIAGFLSVVAAVIVGLGWVVPTLVVLALVWFLVTRVRRRFA
jgi:hypothetical protein